MPSSLQSIGILSPSTLSGTPAWSATFSIDGKYLAVCFGNPNTHIKIYDVTSLSQNDASSNTTDSKDKQDIDISKQWKLISTIREEHTRTIRSVSFAPTSSTISVPILASASFDGKVLIWECYPDAISTNVSQSNNDDENSNIENNLFEPIAQLEGHESEVKCLAWNTTGSLLASCGRDKTVWIWECYLPGTIGGSETSNDMQCGGGEEDGGEFECLAVLQGHDGDVKSIVFGPSHSQWGEGDEVLYSASYDNTIKIWAEESGDWYCAATLNDVHSSTIWSLGLTPSGLRLFSGSDDGSIAIWKMYTATERKKLFPKLTGKAVCSTDGLWNCVGKLPDAHSSYAIMSIDCAPSRVGHGRIASAGGDNCINIYREETTTVTEDGLSLDTPKFTIEAVADDAHDGDVNCVKWHPRDGSCLVSCGDDGAVKLWKYQRE